MSAFAISGVFAHNGPFTGSQLSNGNHPTACARSGKALTTRSRCARKTTVIHATIPDITARPEKDAKDRLGSNAIPSLRTRTNRSTTYVREMIGEGGLHSALASSIESDRLVVVKFYAPHCRSCKAVGAKLDKLSKEMYTKMGLQKRDVVMYEVNIANEDNLEFYKKHNVTHLPTFHFYRPSTGMIDGFQSSPSKFGDVRIKIRENLRASQLKEQGTAWP